jgi:hypothetical protein
MKTEESYQETVGQPTLQRINNISHYDSRNIEFRRDVGRRTSRTVSMSGECIEDKHCVAGEKENRDYE